MNNKKILFSLRLSLILALVSLLPTSVAIAQDGFIIAPNSEVSEIALAGQVPSSTVIYAIDIINNKLYKSTNRGDSWSDISGNIPLSSTVQIKDIAVGPDNDNYLAVVTSLDGGGDPKNVWVSYDGGTNWENLNVSLGDNELIQDITMSTSYYCVDAKCWPAIAFGTQTGIGEGEVYIKPADEDSFQSQGFLGLGDVYALRFSPAYYPGDFAIIVVSATDTGTFLNSGQHDPFTNTTTWNSEIGYPVLVGSDSPNYNQIVFADLELPFDFFGDDPNLRRYFISYDSNGTVNGDDVYRLNNTLVYRLNANPDTPGNPISLSSIAFFGTSASGKLLAGLKIGEGSPSYVRVLFTSDPHSSFPTWVSSSTHPRGPANAKVLWSPNAGSDNTAFVGTSTTGGAQGDDSGFSRSTDNGSNWVWLSLKDGEVEEPAIPEFTITTIIIAAIVGFGIYLLIRRRNSSRRTAEKR